MWLPTISADAAARQTDPDAQRLPTAFPETGEDRSRKNIGAARLSRYFSFILYVEYLEAAARGLPAGIVVNYGLYDAYGASGFHKCALTAQPCTL